MLRRSMNLYGKVMASYSWMIVVLVVAAASKLGGGAEVSNNNKNEVEKVVLIKLGVILNSDSYTGKQVYAAMQIACHHFNAISSSKPFKLQLHHKTWTNPFDALTAAEELIKRKRVKVLITTETWEEASLVAGIGNQFQVPVISLSKNQFTARPKSLPGLIQMGIYESEEIKCIADIIHSYNIQRVFVIYEEESETNYLVDQQSSRSLRSLSEALGDVGSKIDGQLPLNSSWSSSKAEIREKLLKLRSVNESPVVIVLDLSLSMTTHLMEEAREIGFFDQGDSSIWIFSERVVNQLITNVSAVGSSSSSSSLLGLGVITYYPTISKHYMVFRSKFRFKFGHEPSVTAIRAYDCVSIISKATADNSEVVQVQRILASDFEGLSGKIRFRSDGRIVNYPRRDVGVVSIVRNNNNNNNNNNNVITGVSLKHQSCGGFSKRTRFNIHQQQQQQQHKQVNAAENDDGGKIEELKIGVPAHTFFDIFVKEEPNGSYTGFCIDVFNAVYDIITPSSYFRYVFVRHNGTYDDLIQMVHNKSYDAAVGDITILANRSLLVDFTQPFMESGLSMILVAKPDQNKAFILMRPFSPRMWLASTGLLLSTMLTVWFLEHPSNPEFRGPITDQLSSALWFTYSSLFFAHRGRIDRKLTRIVVIVWFFVALILTQSYTASLASMLTVEKLKRSTVTMEMLKEKKALVGCDGATFLCSYLERDHGFDPNSIVHLTINYTDYEKELKNGNIKALFLEYPYEMAFFTRYCNGYSVSHQSNRFGGFGFVFPKGSNLTNMFSEAILELSENGELKRLGNTAFGPECITSSSSSSSSSSTTSTNTSDDQTQSLDLNSFWVLYVLSIATCASCVIYSYLISSSNPIYPIIPSVGGSGTTTSTTGTVDVVDDPNSSGPPPPSSPHSPNSRGREDQEDQEAFNLQSISNHQIITITTNQECKG